MVHQFFRERRPHNGMTYRDYNKKWIDELQNTNPEILSAEDKELFEYKKLNRQRSERIDRSYHIPEDLVNAVQSIKEKELWMVITEPWCGDSAQNLPYIANLASINPNIDFRIIQRDSNPDIMDLYLTNGARSIPKLIAFDMEGNELFNWGPRPRTAQELMHQWKSQGIVKPELYEKLHLWYSRNKGRDLTAELLEIFEHVDQN